MSILCLALGWSQIKSFISFPIDKIQDADNTITVLTLNTSNAVNGYKKSLNNRLDILEKFSSKIKEYNDVDILCLQEVGHQTLEILEKEFKGFKIHHIGKGAAILSKHPIIKKGEINFGTITNSCLWADINSPIGKLRVYSFHLHSNKISSDAEKLAAQKEFDRKKAWYDIKGMLRKYKNTHVQRSKQVKMIIEHAHESEHPILLAGDLNDHPQSYTYNEMNKIANDSYKIRGNGFGTTYAGLIPFLRIDYIFADKSLDVVSFKTISDDLSDHYAIKVALK